MKNNLMDNKRNTIITLDKAIDKYERLKIAKERMMSAVTKDFKGIFLNEINLINIMLNDLKFIKNNMEA